MGRARAPPRFAEIGYFRIGVSDNTHLTIGHQNGNVEHIFRSDGTLHGNVHSFNPFGKSPLRSDRFEYAWGVSTKHGKQVQLDKWRIGVLNVRDGHLVVGHQNGNVAAIYRSDGTIHGNHRGWNPWKLDG